MVFYLYKIKKKPITKREPAWKYPLSQKTEDDLAREQQIKDDYWVNEQVETHTVQIKELRTYEGELILEYEALINNYGGTKPELN